MRLFYFILTGSLALCACQTPVNKGLEKDIILQNSGPKGGASLDSSRTPGYTDAAGKRFGYAIFWTAVINKTDTPLEININFPADSLAFFPSPDSYSKLFLLPDTMTLEKESLYNYGVKDLRSFLDTGFNKPTRLQRTIKPKEHCLFYVATITHQPEGVVRAGLVLKEQELFYKFKIGQDSALIPCGRINFKN